MTTQPSRTYNPGTISQVTPKAREGKPLILIVEDHEDTRFLLSFVMEHCGFRVLEALDGVEAVRLAASSLPDLILMDTTLPRCDGLMATRDIRSVSRLRHVPIIFISGHAQPEARAAALATGGNEYFIKPINLRDLEIAVKKELASNGWFKSDISQNSYQARIAS